MKLSIVLTCLIFALGIGLGMRNRQQLTALRENHARLAAGAGALGISSDHYGNISAIRRSVREDRQAAAKEFAAELIALLKENDALEEDGGTPDEASRNRFTELIKRMASLDAAQLQSVISEVRAASGLNENNRKMYLGLLVMSLSGNHPHAALALLADRPDYLKDEGTIRHVLDDALRSLARDDPMAAIEWLRNNPDHLTEDVKNSIVYGAATKDPVLAFQMIRELKVDDGQEAVSGIIRAASTPEERTSALAALRGYLSGIQDPDERMKLMGTALVSLTHAAVNDGFREGAKWISGAGFSAQETETIASSLAFGGHLTEEDRWIEWAGEKIPADKIEELVPYMVYQWTQKDHRAAGTWLAKTPEGPTKNAAVCGYAEAITPYDPQTAVQWVLTLPDGEKRTRTLAQIFAKWPKDDAAGAEAFAKEHGIAK